jgi:SHAQKYF class myb-like DNA-binding protein
VAAIFDVGLKHASPKAILEQMTNTRELTTDHIKSHLQKYRLHRDRAREEFISTYGQPQYNPTNSEPFGAGGADGLAGSLKQLGAAIKGAVPLPPPQPVLPTRVLPLDSHDPVRAQMGLIRECLQMQSGFQNVLRQALLTQQQLQTQLQAHLQAIGLDPPSAGGQAGGAAQGDGPGKPPVSTMSDAIAAGASGLVAMAQGSGPSKGEGAASSSATATATGANADGAGPDHAHAAQAQGQAHADGKGEQQPAAKRTAEEQMQVSQSFSGWRQALAVPPEGSAIRRNSWIACACVLCAVQEEMREHMDLHRQLVLRRNAQVSMYEDMPPHSSSNAAAAAGAQAGMEPQPQPPLELVEHVDLAAFKWNEDDDHLFSFLMDHPGSS